MSAKARVLSNSILYKNPITMKNILNNIMAAALLAVATASCSNDTDMPATGTPAENALTRELTISVAPVSRTTIDYENSDFSHLVWSEGDEVAYVTDVYGDVFRTAAISHNTFKAVIPQDADRSNKLIIVYPAGDLNGKALSECSLGTVNPATLNIDQPFDGTRLPLCCEMQIPASSTITADFEVMGSVIRLNLEASGHEEELLHQIVLTANEPLTGNYRRSFYGWFLDGGSKSVSMDIAGEDLSLAAISSQKRYIYIVTPRNEFTGVGLTVTTSTGTYTFSDGAMNLAQEGRTLYRLDLPLGEPVPVREPMYRQITSMSDITTGDDTKYLLVCGEKSVVYAEYNSTNYYDGVPVTIGSDGIDPECAAAKAYRFTIHPFDESGNLYYMRTDEKVGKGYYISTMANFPGTPGKIYFTADGGQNRNSWNISFDGSGNVILQGHPHTQDVAGDVFLCFYRPGNYFATYGADANMDNICPMQLYKLTD